MVLKINFETFKVKFDSHIFPQTLKHLYRCKAQSLLKQTGLFLVVQHTWGAEAKLQHWASYFAAALNLVWSDAIPLTPFFFSNYPNSHIHPRITGNTPIKREKAQLSCRMHHSSIRSKLEIVLLMENGQFRVYWVAVNSCYMTLPVSILRAHANAGFPQSLAGA